MSENGGYDKNAKTEEDLPPTIDIRDVHSEPIAHTDGNRPRVMARQKAEKQRQIPAHLQNKKDHPQVPVTHKLVD